MPAMEEKKKKKSRATQPTVLEWSRYLELDRCLRDRMRRYRKEDLVEAVNRKLERYDYEPVSKRTIEGDLQFMMSEAGFGAVLETRYDGHTKIYSYEDKTFSIMNLPMTDRESDMLAATIAMLSRFSGMPNYQWLENTLRMLRTKFNVGDKTASVAMEQNKKLNGLADWFETLFEACRKRLIVTMKYSRFDRLDKEPATRVIEPYQMRQHNQRWYLVGREETKQPRLQMVVVPIDRIQEVQLESVEERDDREERGEKFVKPTDAMIEAYFKDVVGVSRLPEGEPVTVKLKAWGLTAHFIETKPIHHSQKVVGEGEMEVEGPWYKKNPIRVMYKEFELTVIPNEPLIQALLVYGNECQILEPESLRKDVVKRAQAILKYNKDENHNENAMT